MNTLTTRNRTTKRIMPVHNDRGTYSTERYPERTLCAERKKLRFSKEVVMPDYLQETQTGWQAEKLITTLLMSRGVNITPGAEWTDRIGNDLITGEFIGNIEND